MDPTKQKRIENRIVHPEASLLECLHRMDESNCKLLLVFQQDRFQSLVSIGDIQRAIIGGHGVNEPIKPILRTRINLASPQMPMDAIRAKMLELRAELMPVVDEDLKLVDVHFWDEQFSQSPTSRPDALSAPVVIMAGGKGTRLKPLTNVLPKPLIPIGEKPIMEVIIDRFNAMGVTNFFATVNYQAEMIRYYFNRIENASYQLNYIYEDKPLGTAGSLKMLRDQMDQTFFVTNCDILINDDYSEIYRYHKELNNELTLVGAFKHIAIPYGSLTTGEESQLIDIVEKPELSLMVNTGMYIYEPHLLHEIPDDEFFHVTDLIQKIKERNGRIGVFPISEKSWFDMGQWPDYLSTIDEFEKRFS